MSTRCTINFKYEGHKDIVAKIYRHSDGYPEGEHGVPADLERFFQAVKDQTNDWRFEDPSYLAAKYVVWEADQHARIYDDNVRGWVSAPPLNFLGVGVLLTDPSDIKYRYFVNCQPGGNPAVTWEKCR